MFGAIEFTAVSRGHWTVLATCKRRRPLVDACGVSATMYALLVSHFTTIVRPTYHSIVQARCHWEF